MRGSAPRRTRIAATALAILMGVTACSNGDSGGEDADVGPTGKPEPTRISADVAVGKITGRLPAKKRKAVVKDVGAVVVRWMDAAYLGVYPRGDFSDAFRGFTDGAERLARHDRELMSNAGIGSRLDAVTPVREVVRVDILGARKHAAGATARFRLVFRTEGQRTQRVTVRGRLVLTQARGKGWKVFAYDVARSARTAGGKSK